MSYCNSCGSFVLGEDRFCPQCGTSQRPESGAGAAESKTTPGAPTPPAAPSRPAGERPAPSPPEAAAPSPPEAGPPPAAGPPPSGAEPLPPAAARAAGRGRLEPNIAAMLCYLPGMGWIVAAAVLFFNLDPYRENRYVRFHAFQGLYLGALWLLAHTFFFPFFGDPKVFPFTMGFRSWLKLLVVVAQVIGIIKTLKNQQYRLPVLGELAEKSLA